MAAGATVAPNDWIEVPPTDPGDWVDVPPVSAAPSGPAPKRNEGMGKPSHQETLEEGLSKEGPLMQTLFAPVTGAIQAGQGVKALATEPGLKAKARGASDLVRGAMGIASPYLAEGLVTAPLATTAALATGIGAQKAVEKGGEALGVPPEYTALASDVAALGAGGLAAKGVSRIGRPAEVPAAPPASPPEPTPPPFTGGQYLQSFAKGPPKTAAQESAEAFSGPAYAELFDQADKLAANRARTKPTVPEESISERVARVQDARERLSQKLTGKSWSTANNSDRIAIDDLVNEDLGFAADPGDWIDVPAEKPLAATAAPTTEDWVDVPPAKPTAETPTVPETPDTIDAQMQQLQAGARKAVMVPAGTKMPSGIPDTLKTIRVPRVGNFVFDPTELSPREIRRAAKFNRLPEILGAKDGGMGVPDKTELEPPVAAVVGKTPEGVTTQGALTDEANLPAAFEQTAKVTPTDGSVSIVPPEAEVSARLNDPEWIEPTATPEPAVSVPPQTGTPAPGVSTDDTASADTAPLPNQKPLGLTASKNSERGAVDPDFLTLGGLEFVKQSVIPGTRTAKQMLIGAADDVKKLFAPQTRGEYAAKGAGLIREAGASTAMARDQAAGKLLDARKYFSILTPDQNYAFADAVETGRPQSLPPEQMKIARRMSEMLDASWKEVNKRGLLDQYIENYFPHSYKETDDAANWLQNWMGRRPMAGSEAFRKERSFPTLRDARAAGLTPKYTNAVDFVLDKLGEMQRSIQAHDIIEELKTEPAPEDSGFDSLMPTLEMGKRPAAGWARINDRIATGRIAPEPLARVINEHLAPGIAGSPLYQVWRGATNTANMLDLSLSYYHGATTTLNSSLSDMALALQQAAAGRPIAAGKSLARGAVPFASIVDDVFRGTKIKQVWDGERAPSNEGEAALVDALKAGGGRVRQDSAYATTWADGMVDAFRRGNIWSAGLKAPFALLEKSMAPIMQYMVPRAKLGAFSKLAQLELDRDPTILNNKAKARETFGQAWDSVDNRFGQLVYNNLFMNRIAKDSMMAVVGRPGWNIGTVREIGGGFADFAQNIVDAAQFKGPTLTPRESYVVALFLGGAAMNGLTNYLLTGTAPTGIDYVAPRDGGTDDHGKPTRIVLPLYLSKDLYSYWRRPLETLKAKAAPPLQIAGDLIQNKDFYNRRIYGEGGMGLGAYAKEQLTPYSVQGLERNIEEEKGAKGLLPFVGVMPAPEAAGLTPMEAKLREFQGERPSTAKTIQQDARAQLKGHLLRKFRLGENAETEIGQALKTGLISSKEVRELKQQSKIDSNLRGFVSTDINQAAELYSLANADEKAKLQRAMRQKVRNEFSKPGLWNDQTRRLISTFGMPVPPAAH